MKLLNGMKTVAVPAPNGDPLVGPMNGWFLHGKFFFSSSGDAVRIKGLRARPRASVVYFDGEKFAVIAPGVYVRLDADRFFTYSRTPKAFPG